MESPVPGIPTVASTALPDYLSPLDSCPAVRSMLGSWLALQRALAFKPQLAVELLRRHPHPAAALAASKQFVEPADPSSEIAALARSGAVALPLPSPAYPERLAALSDPAPLLHVRGDVAALSGPIVGIVGARAATVYGKHVARNLARALAEQGIVIVSGMARGIDAAAHLGALEAGGQTIAVAACGIDRIYPPEHRGLAERIAAQGAVITEMPLRTQPRAPHFPLRNRLISGLSLAIVVVEARERSGSLITANHAANQGRDVFVIPGPINAPTSRGTNLLLRDGAYVALGPDEILQELGMESRPARPRKAEAPASAPAREILKALADEPASRDELGRRLGREPAQLALELVEFELAGRVVEDRDGRLRIVDLPE
jgi:DNA processing protein